MKKFKPYILIVDDSQNWRELLSMVFDQECEVFCTATYEEAQRALIEHIPPFDVAIIDLRLDDADPENQDGLRLLKDIQQQQIETKAIILTGYPSIQSSKLAFRDLGAYEYLEKYPPGGLDIANLRQVIQQAIGERRILLVEDDPRWQEMLADILLEDGYTVDRASNQLEALQHFQVYRYPVAVVDLKLGTDTPDQGIGLLEYVNEINPQAGLVVVSGYGSRERVRDAFELGKAKAFIFKEDFSPSVFREKIRQVVRSF